MPSVGRVFGAADGGSTYAFRNLGRPLPGVHSERLAEQADEPSKEPLREQIRLYGHQLDGPSFGFVAGWLEPTRCIEWEVQPVSKVVVCWHRVPRRQLLCASQTIATKFPAVVLTGRRKTFFRFEGEDPDYIVDQVSQGQKMLRKPWVGRTEFEICCA